jgi:hypothetical protein
MHVFTAAFRTLDLVLFVFRKSENDFEWLVAIFAEKFVSRHDDPHRTPQTHFTAPDTRYGGDENAAPKGRADVTEREREGE